MIIAKDSEVDLFAKLLVEIYKKYVGDSDDERRGADDDDARAQQHTRNLCGVLYFCDHPYWVIYW
jgi:hypothetical protein